MKYLVILLALVLSGCEQPKYFTKNVEAAPKTIGYNQTSPGSYVTLTPWCVDGVVYYTSGNWFGVAFNKDTNQPKTCEMPK